MITTSPASRNTVKWYFSNSLTYQQPDPGQSPGSEIHNLTMLPSCISQFHISHCSPFSPRGWRELTSMVLSLGIISPLQGCQRSATLHLTSLDLGGSSSCSVSFVGGEGAEQHLQQHSGSTGRPPDPYSPNRGEQSVLPENEGWLPPLPGWVQDGHRPQGSSRVHPAGLQSSTGTMKYNRQSAGEVQIAPSPNPNLD